VVLLALAIAGLFILPDPWRFIFLGAVVVFEVGEVYFWIRFLRRYRVRTGVEGMVGEVAKVIEPCDPEGRVRLRGETWSARSTAAAAPGALVEVSGVENLTLVVEPKGGGNGM
jgi:membrane protein implicated in regulation of membrane protease activity